MLRKISMSLCCMVILLMFSSSVGASVKLFTDVYCDDWYARDVYSLVEKGIINGYPDNTFKGDQSITRAEYVTILSGTDNVAILDNSDIGVSLSDIDNHWAEPYITLAVTKGFISGCGDGTFQPDKPITREEAFLIIYRIITLSDSEYISKDVSAFVDENECSEWALESIRYLHSIGIVNGYSDNSVKPKNEITRGEVAALLRQVLGYEKYDGDIGSITRPIPVPEPEPEPTPVPEPEPTPVYDLLGTYKITFYCPNGCCGSANGATASGNKCTPYKTVAMKGIPFGTVIRIEFSRPELQYLNGEYVVEDRGVGYNVVDVCIESHSLCYQLGVDRGAKVYIVKY